MPSVPDVQEEAKEKKPREKKEKAKAEVKHEAKKEKKVSSLTASDIKVLKALSKSGKPLTRNELREQTGINKGWSRILGSATREVSEHSLEGRKMVKCEQSEESGRTLLYTITATGKNALAKTL